MTQWSNSTSPATRHFRLAQRNQRRVPVKDVADVATNELPLNDEKTPEVKKNRHVTIALNHLDKRRDALTTQNNKLTAERDEVDAARKALGVSE